jgi:hypothetical protein
MHEKTNLMLNIFFQDDRPEKRANIILSDSLYHQQEI